MKRLGTDEGATSGEQRTPRALILDGERACRARAEVQALVAALAFDGLYLSSPDVARGRAGVALFLHHAARAGFEGADEQAQRHLDAAIDALASQTLGPDLYGGFTGVGWVAAQVQALPAEEDGFEALDEALLAHASQAGDHAPFDLVEGWTGMGVYALARGAAGRFLLARLVERLVAGARTHPAGVAWETPPASLPPFRRARFPEGVLDLGVAHGTPGVAWLLARAAALGVEAARARALAEAAVRWVLAARRTTHPGQALPAFLPRCAPASDSWEPARSAWCYGDPGAGLALLDAAQRLGLRDVEAELLTMMRAAAQLPEAHTGVRDVSLCHGAAGLAHLYGRMYRATGEALFRDAACDWFDRTLALRRPGAPCGGYWTLQRDDQGQKEVPDASLLNGAAGVGLALLSALLPEPPGWDRLLLADLGSNP